MHLARPGRLPLALTLAACAVGACLALATPSAHATARPQADATSTLPSRLQQTIRATLRANPSFPGVALVVRAPGFRYAGAVGVADREAHTRLAPTAPFRIASITKTFTAAAILRLAERGALALDDPIDRHLSLPTLALLRDDDYDPHAITLRMLLQHTSGIADFASDPAYLASVAAQPRHRWTRAEQIRFATTHDDPLGAPGSSFHYSDTGYLLLGETIERASGLSAARAYRTLLRLDQLGLDHTYLETLEPARGATTPRMHQYLATADSWALDPSFDLYGSGGLVSTLDDLARFYRALLTGHVLARPASLRAMRGAAHPTAVDQLGLGLFAIQLGSETCYGHQGFWGSSVTYCPKSRITIASTVNQAEDFEAASANLHTTVHELTLAATNPTN